MKMAELTQAVVDAGLREVSTLQVAGNIIFDDAGASADEWAATVRRAVLERFGFDLPVIVRSHDQLVDLIERNPFVGTQEGKWVMTTMLDRRVADAAAAEFDPQQFAPDAFVVDGTEIFARYEAGVGTSKLQPAWFEKRLDVIGTARNANTLAKLAEMTSR